MGRRSGRGAPQGWGAADVPAGHRGISLLLQAVASAGHAGVGPAVYGADRGAAAAGQVATGGVEGGVELVFPHGGFHRGAWLAWLATK